MNPRPSDLPDFANPPVTEVALGVQFVPVMAAHTYQFVQLAQVFAGSEFQISDEQPLLEPMPQETEESAIVTEGLVMDVSGVQGPPRYWLANESNTVLLQLQRDRFVLNWRLIEPGATYPRYEPLRAAFEAKYRDLERAITDLQIGALVPTQCQIDYINPIEPPRGVEHTDDVLTVWKPEYSDGFLGEPDLVRLIQAHTIRSDRSFRGRLYISSEPARSPAGQLAIVLALTARGGPLGEGLAGVLAFFDLGRDWIVRGFASVTTSQMHQVWRRTNKE